MIEEHNPVVIEDFNGLWKRGDPNDPLSSIDSCPLDHFSDCNNVQFIQSGFKTRDGLDTYLPYANVLRIFTFVQQSGESLLVLTTGGKLFHTTSPTLFAPILVIPTMIDFSVVSIAGRAYITPHDGVTGLANEFIYVYLGDGTMARKAAGFPPVSPDTGPIQRPMVAYNNENDGDIKKGIHVFAVAFGNAGGDIGILGPGVILPSVQRDFPLIDAPGSKQATLDNLPLTNEVGVNKWVIATTKAIDPKDFNPDPLTHTYYKVAELTYSTTNRSISGSFKDTDLTVDLTSHLTTASGSAPPGPPVTTAFIAVNSSTNGNLDAGFRLIGVVYETNTGFLTAPGPEFYAPITTTTLSKKINLYNIPISPDFFVTKRRFVSTKVITNYNGDQTIAQFFFIPNAVLNNNTTTFLEGLEWFDADLLEDASHLIDNFSEIPASVGLDTYHNRLLSWAEHDNISLVRASISGEPEAISQVDGVIVVPLDGKPVTHCQEFRDVLYVFKSTRTLAYNDNGDVPSSWLGTILEQGIGTSVDGIAEVLDSGGVDIDYLIVSDYSGVILFNGSYIRPELTYKVRDLWLSLKKEDFLNIQIVNDTLNQIIYVTFPNKRIIIGDYSNGLNANLIRWAPWSFDIDTTTIALIDINRLVIGSKVAPSLRQNEYRYVGGINFRFGLSAILSTSSRVSTFTYNGSIDGVFSISSTVIYAPINIFSYNGVIDIISGLGSTSITVPVKLYSGLITMTSGIAGTYSFTNPHINMYAGSIDLVSTIEGTYTHNKTFIFAGSI